FLASAPVPTTTSWYLRPSGMVTSFVAAAGVSNLAVVDMPTAVFVVVVPVVDVVAVVEPVAAAGLAPPVSLCWQPTTATSATMARQRTGRSMRDSLRERG